MGGERVQWEMGEVFEVGFWVWLLLVLVLVLVLVLEFVVWVEVE